MWSKLGLKTSGMLIVGISSVFYDRTAGRWKLAEDGGVEPLGSDANLLAFIKRPLAPASRPPKRTTGYVKLVIHKPLLILAEKSCSKWLPVQLHFRPVVRLAGQWFNQHLVRQRRPYHRSEERRVGK